MAGRVCLIDATAKNEGSEAADPNVRFGSGAVIPPLCANSGHQVPCFNRQLGTSRQLQISLVIYPVYGLPVVMLTQFSAALFVVRDFSDGTTDLPSELMSLPAL
jgi:hypothetical protein